MGFIFNMEEQISFHQMLTWFLSKKSQHLDNEGEWVVNMIAKSIGLSYRALPRDDIKCQELDVNINAINVQDYLGRDADYLQPILRLKDFVNFALAPLSSPILTEAPCTGSFLPFRCSTKISISSLNKINKEFS